MKKYRDILTGLGVAAILLLAFVLLVGTKRNSSQFPAMSNPNLVSVFKAEEDHFDFGTISMARGKVSHIFKFKNAGNSPLTLNKIYTSCMCTEAALLKNGQRFGPFGMPGHGFSSGLDETLKAGEEAEIEATFDPAAHGPAGVGAVERVIYVESDSAEPLELHFSANVTP